MKLKKADLYLTLPFSEDKDKVLSLLKENSFCVKSVRSRNGTDSNKVCMGEVLSFIVSSRKFKSMMEFSEALINSLQEVFISSFVFDFHPTQTIWEGSNFTLVQLAEKISKEKELCEAIDALEKENKELKDKELKEKSIKKIKWNGLRDPYSDLSIKRCNGYYDVITGVDGWIVTDPFGNRWVYNDQWATTFNRPSAATREEARLFAETLIRKNEGL